MQTWTERDFDALSWHDCHVHGWGLVEVEHGRADLTLDLDFILAWERPGDGAFVFVVAPATLVFFAVFALRFEIDYAGFAVAPFSLHGIERELRVDTADHREHSYRLEINSPRGLISFAGDRFRQTLRAAPIRTADQWLEPGQRAALFRGE